MELPVSGMGVRFRVPDGNDDMAILAAAGGAVEQALTILPRLAQLTMPDSAAAENDGRAQTGWKELTVTDFETALLGLRRFLFGDRVGCVLRASSHKCGVPMEMEFSISAFLANVKPGAPRDVEQCVDQKGWFKLTERNQEEVRFRLPSVEDQAEVVGRSNATQVLTQRCIEATRLGSRTRMRVERAMEVMAPVVSRPLVGQCADCGEALTMTLNVPRLVLDEFRIFASGVHEDVHAIASTYHWDEAAILAMPQSRRQAYATAIRRHLGESL
jgi:hypothetical protein